MKKIGKLWGKDRQMEVESVWRWDGGRLEREEPRHPRMKEMWRKF